MAKNRFWQFRNAAGGGNELTIYGEISDTSWYGDEVTPSLFRAELDRCEGDLTIYINSGGGDVFAGFAIFNMLNRYRGKKTVYIDGLAASIASVIAMAGDEIVMPENAMLMIHNAWTFCAGNKNDLRKMADEVELIDGLIADVYAGRSGKTREDYAPLMDAETWFTAKDAKDAGLIDTIEEGKRIAASMDGDFLCANGVRIDTRRFEHAETARGIAAPEEDHSNRAETQPVDDADNTALEDQRKKFNEAKLKIAERMSRV